MEKLHDFNEQQIQLLFGDNIDLMEQVLEILQEDLPSHLKNLDKAIEFRDGNRVYEIAHTLKGSMASVGADKGSSLAKHIQREAEENQFETCRTLFVSLNETTGQFLREFSGSIKTKKEHV